MTQPIPDGGVFYRRAPIGVPRNISEAEILLSIALMSEGPIL
jgi:hypothetical protein